MDVMDRRSWPSWTLAGAALVDLEALLAGWLAPLTGNGDAVQGPGGLAARALDVSVRVSPEVASRATVGQPMALREPEGTAIAALHVESVDASGRVRGRLDALERVHHDEYPELWLSPTDVAARVDARAGAIVYVADHADPDGVWSALDQEARATGASLVVLLPSGAPDVDGGLDLLRLRALHDRAVRLAVPAVVAVVPFAAADPWTSPERLVLATRSAGGAVLAVSLDGRSPDDVARLEAFAADAGVRVRPLRVSGDPSAILHTSPPAEFRVGRGFAVFFTGLSGSGKSTIARALRARLIEGTGRPVSLLDGDLVRRHLSSELGFSREHRDVHVRRIGWVASEVVRHGGMAICAPIAPYDETRRAIRAMIEPHGGFLLVYVATPLEACEARDRKGLYAKARAGLVPNFTGISDPYEPPSDASLVIDTTGVSVDDACRRVIDRLVSAGWLASER